MKGATIGHAKQRIRDGRYIGITEPGIIAAESPNPIVNHLVIMPDIEKRLEAFVRMRARDHRVPGRRRHGRGDPLPARHPARSGERGAAVAADLHRARRPRPSTSSRSTTSSARRWARRRSKRYQIIIGDPAAGRARWHAASKVREHRRAKSDAFYFNWPLKIPPDVPAPVRADARSHGAARAAPRPASRTSWPPTCAAPSPASSPATSRRRACGDRGARPVRDPRRPGHHDAAGRAAAAFVEQKRMKLAGEYRPCYRLVA